MPKVLCTLPNASTKINGVAFVTHKLGMISEEIDDAVAKQFAAIRGYEIWDPGKTDAAAAAILEAARKQKETGQGGAKTGGETGAPSNPTPPQNSTPPANPSAPPPQGESAKDGATEPQF
jgi:hypothetical protein